MYYLLSLLLGLLSWILGAAAIRKPFSLLTPASLLFCSLSLLLQLVQARSLVLLGDWSALMDTMDAVVLAATALQTVTAGLNIAAFLRSRAYRKR